MEIFDEIAKPLRRKDPEQSSDLFPEGFWRNAFDYAIRYQAFRSLAGHGHQAKHSSQTLIQIKFKRKHLLHVKSNKNWNPPSQLGPQTAAPVVAVVPLLPVVVLWRPQLLQPAAELPTPP